MELLREVEYKPGRDRRLSLSGNMAPFQRRKSCVWEGEGRALYLGVDPISRHACVTSSDGLFARFKPPESRSESHRRRAQPLPRRTQLAVPVHNQPRHGEQRRCDAYKNPDDPHDDTEDSLASKRTEVDGVEVLNDVHAELHLVR